MAPEAKSAGAACPRVSPARGRCVSFGKGFTGAWRLSFGSVAGQGNFHHETKFICFLGSSQGSCGREGMGSSSR